MALSLENAKEILGYDDDYYTLHEAKRSTADNGWLFYYSAEGNVPMGETGTVVADNGHVVKPKVGQNPDDILAELNNRLPAISRKSALEILSKNYNTDNLLTVRSNNGWIFTQPLQGPNILYVDLLLVADNGTVRQLSSPLHKLANDNLSEM